MYTVLPADCVCNDCRSYTAQHARNGHSQPDTASHRCYLVTSASCYITDKGFLIVCVYKTPLEHRLLAPLAYTG